MAKRKTMVHKNIIQKSKDWETWTSLKSVGEFMFPGRVRHSYHTRVTVLIGNKSGTRKDGQGSDYSNRNISVVHCDTDNPLQLTKSWWRPYNFRSDDFILTTRNPWFSNLLFSSNPGNSTMKHKFWNIDIYSISRWQLNVSKNKWKVQVGKLNVARKKWKVQNWTIGIISFVKFGR